MRLSEHDAFLMFMALFALYSPLAALSSYLPVVGPFPPPQQRRLALGMFTYVAVFAVATIWVGEPLLELLGITTAALAVTGGIALLYAGVPMMRGLDDPEPGPAPDGGEPPVGAAHPEAWRRVLFTPLVFPLTVGGTTFGLIVAFAASSPTTAGRVPLTGAGLAYAALTGVTVLAAGQLHRRVSPRARMVLGRVAGILLTAIAVSLIASGGTRLVVDVLEGLGR